MSEPDAAGLSLVGGVLALDFVNTAAGRESGRPFDHLHRPGDLIAWAAHAGALPAAAAARCRAAAAADAGGADALLRKGIQLREAIHRIAAAIARKRTPEAADLDALKEAARRSLGPAALAPAGSGHYGFDFSAAPPEAAVLGPIAWSAVGLLETTPFDRIKECPGDGCGWLFLDASKNNSRRWCDMATCGNRLKGRRHRERQ